MEDNNYNDLVDKSSKNLFEESLRVHKELKGKIEINAKVEVRDNHDLAVVYTPGVAEVSKQIAERKEKVDEFTMRGNTIAIVSDGSAVLGLGNIGAEAALPVMEGKSLLFKKFANVNAVPLCIKTQDKEEIINFVKNISPTFGGINLEDISAPRCFEIERELQGLGIPVFHDDQHGTAIVVLAALINSLKLVNKKFEDVKIVINGAGAAGSAIANFLNCIEEYFKNYKKFKDIIVCDSKGIINKDRGDIQDNSFKMNLAEITNKDNIKGKISDALVGVDVFIGVSVSNVLTREMIKSMNLNPIIFAMANPVPEIFPEEALSGGAFIVGTGRSDYPNQINNLLAFPGVFKGALDCKAKKITNPMKFSAAFAIADSVDDLSVDNILPSALSENVHKNVADAVKKEGLFLS